MRKKYNSLLLFLLIVGATCSSIAVARDKPGPFLKRDSMMVYPEALKRVPVTLQVSAWAVTHEILKRGAVVDPTTAMLTGAINPFSLHDITVYITDDTCRIEFYVDSLCARRNPNDTTRFNPDSISDSTDWSFDDLRVQVVNAAVKPTAFYWPQNKRLDGAKIRAIYRLTFADKGDLGWQELFGSYSDEELLIFDSTRAVIIR